MTIPFYHVDTFTDRLFSGNPAGVCVLEQWLDIDVMQSIAAELNLPATAFIRHSNDDVHDDVHIRWFSPTTELALCGHGTLAAAFVLFDILHVSQRTLRFVYGSGVLPVSTQDNWITIELPADIVHPLDLTDDMLSAFSIRPTSAYRGDRDIMLVFKNRAEIEQAVPNMDAILQIDTRGIIITAAADDDGKSDVDFVSRFFAPRAGIGEDAVTGSAHTSLVPFWSNRLRKTNLTARQLSQRGGILICTYKGDRVYIAGQAVLYSSGEITT